MKKIGKDRENELMYEAYAGEPDSQLGPTGLNPEGEVAEAKREEHFNRIFNEIPEAKGANIVYVEDTPTDTVTTKITFRRVPVRFERSAVDNSILFTTYHNNEGDIIGSEIYDDRR